MSIKIKLDGFDDLLNQIQKAGGTAESAAQKCLEKSAEIMHGALQVEMRKSNVDSGLISRMPTPEMEADGNRFTARVGYKKGEYNENNPSDGYKVVFANYGTPNRSKHGKQPAKGFIQRAKKKARPQIKKAQQETLDDIVKGLN